MARHNFRPAAERFWGKVDLNGPVPAQRPELGPCWVWLAGLSKGYGQFSPTKHSPTAAHRWAYEASGGVIPDGYDIDHLCRNRACVNPSHLEPVTRQVNLLRGEGVTARKAQQTHCIRGHEFTPENTRRIRQTGCRLCRQCDRARKAADWRAAHPVGTPPRNRGELHRRARHSDSEIVEVKRQVAAGVPVALVAQTVDVHPNTVWKWLRGTTRRCAQLEDGQEVAARQRPAGAGAGRR